MKKLNNPKLLVLLAVVLVFAIWGSIKMTNKVTYKDARDSIYLDEEEAAAMVEAFKDGSAYSSTGNPQPAQQQAPANGQ